MSELKEYQVFVDLVESDDPDSVIMESFIVKAESAADAEGVAWHYMDKKGFLREYQEVYLWDISEDDIVSEEF